MFYKLMFLEVGQGYPQHWRERRASSVSQKVYRTCTRGRFNSICVRLDRISTQPCRGQVLRVVSVQESRPFSAALLLYFCPGRILLSGCTSQRTEKHLSPCHNSRPYGAWLRQPTVAEKPAGCFNSARVAAARGNRSSTVNALIFILFCWDVQRCG